MYNCVTKNYNIKNSAIPRKKETNSLKSEL